MWIRIGVSESEARLSDWKRTRYLLVRFLSWGGTWALVGFLWDGGVIRKDFISITGDISRFME